MGGPKLSSKWFVMFERRTNGHEGQPSSTYFKKHLHGQILSFWGIEQSFNDVRAVIKSMIWWDLIIQSWYVCIYIYIYFISVCPCVCVCVCVCVCLSVCVTQTGFQDTRSWNGAFTKSMFTHCFMAMQALPYWWFSIHINHNLLTANFPCFMVNDGDVEKHLQFWHVQLWWQPKHLQKILRFCNERTGWKPRLRHGRACALKCRWAHAVYRRWPGEPAVN